MNLILVKGWTQFLDDKRQIIGLVDLEAKLNLINYD